MTLIVRILATFIFGISSVCNGADHQAEDLASVSIAPRAIDFGEVSPWKTNKTQVLVTNTGSRTLYLEELKRSCSCVAAVFDEASIAPGGHAPLDIRLNFSGYSSNRVRASVSLLFGGGASAQLQVTAEVMPEIAMEPAQLDFGALSAWETLEQTLTLRPRAPEPVFLERIVVPKGISATPDKPRTDRGWQLPVDLAVTLGAVPTAGTFREQLQLYTNVSRHPLWEVSVRARRLGLEARASPGLVWFRPSAPGAEAGRVRLLTSQPAELAKLESGVRGLSFICEQREAALEHLIRLVIDEKAAPGEVYGEVRATLEWAGYGEQETFWVFGTIASPAE